MQKCEWINLIDGRGQNHKAMQVTIGLATIGQLRGQTSVKEK